MDERGKTRISDLGLACKVTPDLVGTYGTRGCECTTSTMCPFPDVEAMSCFASRLGSRDAHEGFKGAPYPVQPMRRLVFVR
jgi:hypothetical protein